MTQLIPGQSHATKTATVFGGSGFIGRALVQALARDGWRVRVATRDVVKAGQMRTFGAVGQIVPVAARVGNPDSVRLAIGDSDLVINLLGILYESGGNSFQAIHVDAAKTIAAAATAAGASRLIHMSSLGASAESPSAYARSKAAGEDAATAAFPGVTIFRPSALFGPNDGLFSRFAGLVRALPVVPLFGGGEMKMQPVYLGDVVSAIMASIQNASTCGKIYELTGPQIVSLRELFQMTMAFTGHMRPLLPVPMPIARIQAAVLGLLPKPPITLDQLKLLATDNLPSGACPGLADLGIAPTPIEAIVPGYLDRFRTGGRFARKRRGPVQAEEG